MKPIYEPKGKAKEYGDYAINIYTGCPHRCYYCFAPSVLRREKETFHSCVQPREGIVEDVKRQLEKEKITGQLIHLCFTCDPYPMGYDTSVTREIIKAVKTAGNHVQILTKGDGSRDFDLLDENDWYGITITADPADRNGYEPEAMSPGSRMLRLIEAKEKGIKTWVSFEPVLNPDAVVNCIRTYHKYFDKVKIGKLNYWPSETDWKWFGREVEALCKGVRLDYYIKEGLRKEMEA